MPEWNKRNYSVVTPQALKEGWLDKELSFILLDIRPIKEAKLGFIKGAVNVPANDLTKALKSFPKKEMKPPIVIYDGQGDGGAEKAAQQLIKSGYPGPRVLTGGFAAWQAGKLAVETGKPSTKIVYVPKPKAGSIPLPEFEGFVKAVPATIQIIDVRNKEEVDETGIVKSALNIPAGDIADRLNDIPKDKEVVTYCSTGARAEMAYNVLKEKGYIARFLDATLTPDKKGGFKISK